METIESLNWIKKNGFYETAKNASLSLKKIFTQCLSVKDEKLLIIGDRGFENKNTSAILSTAYYLAAEQLNLSAKLILQGIKAGTDKADDEVIASISELKNKNIVIVNMSDKLGSVGDLGKSFRKFCNKMEHRFVSATSLGDLNNSSINDVISAIDTNYKVMWNLHEKVKKAFDDAEEINIKTKAGTDLYYNVKGIKSISADGNYSTHGLGGNLPAGEVYLPPNGKRVNGKIVIDGSSRNREHTTIIKEPITIKVEDGNITEVNGGEEARLLEETFEWAAKISKNPGSIRRICELGIGLNPNAKIIGATIVDDKSLGTAHVGIGSNYWFGGSIYAIIHLDQIFKNPEIYVDGKRLEI